MGRIVAAAATSHAFALEDPSTWEAGRGRVSAFYERRYGKPAPQHPRLLEASPHDVQARYARLKEGREHVRQQLAALKPDVLVLIGDDQDETFSSHTFPQIGVYMGESFVCRGRHQASDYVGRGHPEVARAILAECVEHDIDMSPVGQLPDSVLAAHAFGPVLRAFDPEAAIPVVPVFVNCIHLPAPSPARCWLLGQTIGRALASCGSVATAAIVASGGLSHYPGSYPGFPNGDFPYGNIVEQFDHTLMERLAAGRASELAQLTNAELLANGEVELRSWITMLGAIGDAKPDLLVYEALYSGIMGMGLGYWRLG
ncbi:MAG: hypothetical protein JO247_23155 [Chloroflexi bacterium]|nr:hypothetical protein [Chloroflexota bacterium]